MTKLGSTKCYSINNLNRSLKIFPEFSLSAMIFREISLSFPGFPRFFKILKFVKYLRHCKKEVTKAYLGPCHTAITKIFAKIDDWLKSLTISRKSSIIDVWKLPGHASSKLFKYTSGSPRDFWDNGQMKNEQAFNSIAPWITKTYARGICFQIAVHCFSRVSRNELINNY